jgi:hypothetical protein
MLQEAADLPGKSQRIGSGGLFFLKSFDVGLSRQPNEGIALMLIYLYKGLCSPHPAVPPEKHCKR